MKKIRRRFCLRRAATAAVLCLAVLPCSGAGLHAKEGSSGDVVRSVGIDDLEKFESRLADCLVGAKKDCLTKFIRDRLPAHIKTEERLKHQKNVYRIDGVLNQRDIKKFIKVKYKNVSDELYRAVYLIRTSSRYLSAMEMIFITVDKKWYLLFWRFEDKADSIYDLIGIRD